MKTKAAELLRPRRSLMRTVMVLACVVALSLCLAPAVLAWADEHHLITRVAIRSLPPGDQEFLRPEAAAMASTYCAFPDWNHVNQGLWGAGTGDPRGDRMPDNRREWEISRYCEYDPVFSRGRRYLHAPPDSYEATAHYFKKASLAWKQGKIEDGSRIAGIMLHYVQDSGSFPHMQPFHRGIRVIDWKAVDLSGYAPRLLSHDAAGAPAAASRRVRALVEYTERRLESLLAFSDVTLQQGKDRGAKDIAPPQLLVLARNLRREREAEWFRITLDACLESSRACADILHTLIHFASRQGGAPTAHPLATNLVFNPSFEQDDGDGVPDGWVQGWVDLADRTGRADWYRSGTHWTARVRQGKYSVLLLWAPTKGLEWRQTWPKAIQVRPGEEYECSGWALTQGSGGAAFIGAQVSDSAYQPVSTVRSEPLTGEGGWREARFRLTIPDGAKWLRVVLNSGMRDGAAWFDDLRVVRR